MSRIESHVNWRIGRAFFGEKGGEDKAWGGRVRYNYLSGFRRLLK